MQKDKRKNTKKTKQAKPAKKTAADKTSAKKSDKRRWRDIPKKEKRLRTVLSILFLAFTLWLSAPIVSRIAHEGMVFAALSGAGFLLSALPGLYDLIFRRSKLFSRIVVGLIVIGCTALLAILSLLVYGGTRPTKQGATVIVLGCRVNGDTPSLMLQRRIKVAYEYALDNPDCKIIAAGGQGDNEDISEGECIKRSLVEMGIAPERIYVEDKSINTKENLENAAEIIEHEGLSKDVVIATSRFHQYRASLFAKEAGLNSSPLSCGTMLWLAPGYWLREVIGMLRWFILGY